LLLLEAELRAAESTDAIARVLEDGIPTLIACNAAVVDPRQRTEQGQAFPISGRDGQIFSALHVTLPPGIEPSAGVLERIVETAGHAWEALLPRTAYPWLPARLARFVPLR
ncbi:hypothetical protein N9H93_05110, partial [Rhizobiaceae bacterium]|nr:hypothetical protein [Rhizobiaceae bacterium]